MAHCKYENDETKLALLPKVEFLLITRTAGWKCIQNIIFKAFNSSAPIITQVESLKVLRNDSLAYRHKIRPCPDVFHACGHMLPTHAREITNHSDARNLGFGLPGHQQGNGVQSLHSTFVRPFFRIPHFVDKYPPAVFVSMW